MTGSGAAVGAAETPSLPLPLGSTLGRYSLDSVLGQGSMATVYRGRHRLLKHAVAVKVLHYHTAADPMAVSRFFQEAQAIASLQHAQIVKIIGYEEAQGACPAHLIMELIGGRSLQQVVAGGRSLPAFGAVSIAQQICAALAAVHVKGIIHRDLKPGNIMVSETAAAKPHVTLLDFGLAKFLEPKEGGVQTDVGTLVGTPLYMAPEQIRGDPVDERTDIYGVGSLLYTMLAGHPPFVSGRMAELIDMLLSEAPPPLAEVLPPAATAALPAGLWPLIQRCLEKDAAARFSSITELAEALDAVARPRPERIFEGDLVDGLGASSRRRRLVPVLAGLAFAAVAAGFGLLWALG